MSQTDVASFLPEHPVMFGPSTTLDFAEQSQLTYLIPSESNLNLEEAFKNLEPGKFILDSIQRRESLFFGRMSPPCVRFFAHSLTTKSR